VTTALFFGAPALVFLLNQQSFATLTRHFQEVNAAQLNLPILPDVRSITINFNMPSTTSPTAKAKLRCLKLLYKGDNKNAKPWGTEAPFDCLTSEYLNFTKEVRNLQS
jgi:hypothetical protein